MVPHNCKSDFPLACFIKCFSKHFLYFQTVSLVTSSIFTTLTIISIFSSLSIHHFGGDYTCFVFWFSGMFYVAHKIIGGFGIALFRFISLVHQGTFLRLGASRCIKVILTYQVIFYAGTCINVFLFPKNPLPA